MGERQRGIQGAGSLHCSRYDWFVVEVGTGETHPPSPRPCSSFRTKNVARHTFPSSRLASSESPSASTQSSAMWPSGRNAPGAPSLSSNAEESSGSIQYIACNASGQPGWALGGRRTSLTFSPRSVWAHQSGICGAPQPHSFDMTVSLSRFGVEAEEDALRAGAPTQRAALSPTGQTARGGLKQVGVVTLMSRSRSRGERSRS